MAANLTDQVRGIVKVVTAVADGNLRQKLTVEAKGEVAALAETINSMTDTLATFAEQVTNVAREVGVEGRLGGQANVPGAAGTWKDLTGNVNLLAANLTTQVRAIAEVATAVTKGDLTRSIQVEARGEVAELKDNINTMIDNLRGHDRPQPGAGLAQDQPREVHPHAAGPARPRHRRQAAALGARAARQRAAGLGLPDAGRGRRQRAGAARCSPATPSATTRRSASRSAAGSSASARSRSSASCSPTCRRDYTRDPLEPRRARRRRTSSCCRCCSRARPRRSSSWPRCEPFTATHLTFLEQLTQSIGVVLNTIEATMRTENLLQQSQQLTDRAADAADRAAADQRGARVEGQAARRAERRGRAQEQGSRAGAPRARGEGRGAGAHLEVQVRVPREHVARAAHAAQLDPDPRPAARREPGRQPDCQAGRLRAEHPLGRHATC